MYKILIVEDDITISSLMAEDLNKWGYDALRIEQFENVLIEVANFKPHLVLMDINLPSYDGFYWCEQIRKVTTTPVMFISSRTDDKDKIRAMVGGGDGYIEKPFAMDVLIAKVQAMLRRTYDYKDDTNNTLSCDDMVLDIEKMTVTRNEKSVLLTHNESKILAILMRSSGNTATRTQIIKALWDDERFVDENTLTVNVTRLRNKLKQINDEERIITMKGRGYRLV